MRQVLVFWLVISALVLTATDSGAVALVPGDIVFATFAYLSPGDGMVYHVDGVTGTPTLVASGGLL